MGPKGFPETSVRNYKYTLHNNPEEHSLHLKQHAGRKAFSPWIKTEDNIFMTPLLQSTVDTNAGDEKE